ncbi:unnamed protein product, partial [Effrenium voratum]
GLVTTQANAMGQTAQLQSELNSSVKVVGDFGSTVESAAAAVTSLKAEIDSKAFAFTSKLASIETVVNAETRLRNLARCCPKRDEEQAGWRLVAIVARLPAPQEAGRRAISPDSTRATVKAPSEPPEAPMPAANAAALAQGTVFNSLMGEALPFFKGCPPSHAVLSQLMKMGGRAANGPPPVLLHGFKLGLRKRSFSSSATDQFFCNWAPVLPGAVEAEEGTTLAEARQQRRELHAQLSKAIRKNDALAVAALVQRGAPIELPFDLGYGEQGTCVDWAVASQRPQVALQLLRLADAKGHGQALAQQAVAALFWSALHGYPEEMVANQSLNDAQAAAEKLFSTCQCTTHANFNNVKDTVNTSRLVVEDNIELLKYLNCTLGLGQRSDSCVLQSAHQSSINFHTGVVVLTADTICEDSSNSGSGLGSSSGPPLLQIDAWTNFASACSCTQRQNDACNYKCNGLQEKGGQTCFTFTNLGTMTWKECVKKASALGASLCSEDYTEGDGWGGHRNGDTAERFERFYSPKFDLITSQHFCVVGKHNRVTSFDRTLCSQKAEYDGDTWWYHDAGVKYYDECVYLASSAGATIIDPVTIGMGDSIDYWTFTKHSGNVYTYYTGIDTISSHNVGCQSRGDAHKCMFGFMEV